MSEDTTPEQNPKDRDDRTPAQSLKERLRTMIDHERPDNWANLRDPNSEAPGPEDVVNPLLLDALDDAVEEILNTPAEKLKAIPTGHVLSVGLVVRPKRT